MAKSDGRARVRNLALQKALRDREKHGPPSVARDTHQEALDRLENARQRLRDLYEEGRISADELPAGVLLH
jgi:DNA invertase Pin-like site-specific DNA recombinase